MQQKPTSHRHRPGGRGFTLVELLVVLAVVGILASLLLPALSNAKEAGRATVCRGNMRQVALALRLYLDDFDDTFPAASPTGYVFPGNWLYCEQPAASQPGMYNIGNSAIVRYTAGFKTNLFRCPSDVLLRTLDALPDHGKRADPKQVYQFSYTLSSGMLTGKELHYGMASLFWPTRPAVPYDIPSRISMVKDPAGKIMLAEEANYDEPAAQQSPNPDGTASSSGWNWPTDPLTERHRKKSNAALADGHVESVKPSFGRMPEHYDAMQ